MSSPPAVDIHDVIEFYQMMGFTHAKVNRRLYRFSRHPIYVDHHLVRSVGVPLPVLYMIAEARGYLDELKSVMEAKGSYKVWQPVNGTDPPPSELD